MDRLKRELNNLVEGFRDICIYNLVEGAHVYCLSKNLSKILVGFP